MDRETTKQSSLTSATHVRLLGVGEGKIGGSSHAIVIRWTAFIVAFLLITLMVIQQSYAAFTDTAETAANNLATGNLVLDHNLGATAMFNNVTALAPGVDQDSCIIVTYSGSLDPLPVKLFATGAVGALAPFLNMSIDEFTGGTCVAPTGVTNRYAGTLSGFQAAHTSYATGRSLGWDPTGSGESKQYRFRLTVQNDDNAQAKSTGAFSFTWEVQT